MSSSQGNPPPLCSNPLIKKTHTQLVNSILPLKPADHYGISPGTSCCAVVTVVTAIVTAQPGAVTGAVNTCSSLSSGVCEQQIKEMLINLIHLVPFRGIWKHIKMLPGWSPPDSISREKLLSLFHTHSNLREQQKGLAKILRKSWSRFRLEKILKIITYNYQPNTSKYITKPCP